MTIKDTGASSRPRVGIARLPGLGLLSRRDLSDIAERLEGFRDDHGVGAVLLQGSASLFCGGLDLREFCDVEGLDDLAVALERCFLAFALLRKPLVIAVDGMACGFGATMLCHADVVIASSRSRIRMPFLDFGLVPEAGSTMLLRERIGHLAAYRLMCLAEEISAVEAKDVGLVTKVLPVAEVEAVASSDAQCLARRSSSLLAATADLMSPIRADLHERIQTEVALNIQQLRSPAVQRKLSRLSATSQRRSRDTNPHAAEAA